MTPSDFCYWLQGLFELGNPESLDAQQIEIIKDHLDLVMEKQTPDYWQIVPNDSTGPIQITCSLEEPT